MHRRTSGIIVNAGYLAMIVGALDPLEGSILILPGSMLVAFGVRSVGERRKYVYRLWLCLCIALGVAALFGLGAAGGFGGPSGLSNWWGLLVLPYPAGWTLSVWSSGAPRWVPVAGIGVGTWYLVIVLLLTGESAGMPNDGMVAIVIGALGLITIGGCLYRLRPGTGNQPQDR